jgi:hypothetical protein
MTKMEELYMLLFICPRVNHLQINCVNYMHAELLIGLILTQIENVSNELKFFNVWFIMIFFH